MSEFKQIETQEQFESMIKDRLERKAKEVRKEFEGYVSPTELEGKVKEATEQVATLSEQLTAKDTELKELKARSAELELNAIRVKVVNELGLPFGLASRLSGNTEDEIKADAESLKSFVAPPKVAPLANPEASKADPVDAALAEMSRSLGRN